MATSGRGSGVVGYNVQTAVDTGNHLIIAHEVTHAMTADRIGRWRYFHLAAFQQEGYADHVAFARPGPFDFARGRALLERDAPEMNPRRSGLYLRHEMTAVYLLPVVLKWLARRMAENR